MRYLLILFVVTCTALTTACSSTISNLKPFKLEIQQGNVVTSKMLLQLRPGMTKSQVRYIMGTPLIVDSFHTNRWDYIFQLRQSGKITEQKRVVLEFENELLKIVRGDVMPAGADAGAGVVKLTPAAEVTAPKKGNKKDETGESFTDKLKFWKSEDKPVDVTDKANDADKKAVPTPKVDGLLTIPASAVAPATIATDAVVNALTVVTAPLVSDVSPAPAVEAAAIEQAALQPTPAPPSIGPAIEQEQASTSALASPMPEAASDIVLPATESKVVVPNMQADLTPSAPLPISAGSKANTGALSEYELKFERTLDDRNQSKGAASSANQKSTEQKKALEVNNSPGYFERMLEKIGF